MSNEQAAVAEEVEQFEGFTPEGAPPSEQDLDTFSNAAPIELPAKEANQPEAKEEAKPDEKEADDPKQTMDSADELEEKKAGKEAEDEDKEKPSESKAEDSDGKGEGESEKGDSEEKAEPKGKLLHLKDPEGNTLKVPANATVRVDIDGKKEFKTVEELRSAYSGQVAYDKRFTEINNREKEFTAKQEKFETDRKQVVEHFGRIGGMVKDIFQNPDADPVAALRYLVDTSGGDVLHFEKRLMEHFGYQVREYDEMTEAEQELHWERKKNQILTDRQANRAKIEEDRKAQEERQQSEIKTRQEYGVSDKEFEEARNELVNLGYEDEKLTTKAVCEYYQLKPHAEKAEAVCKQFEEEIGTDEYISLIRQTTTILRDNDYLSPEEAVKLAGRKLGFQIEDVNDDISELNEKVTEPKNRLDSSDKSGKKVGKTRSDDHVESFDDYTEDYYQAR